MKRFETFELVQRDGGRTASFVVDGQQLRHVYSYKVSADPHHMPTVELVVLLPGKTDIRLTQGTLVTRVGEVKSTDEDFLLTLIESANRALESIRAEKAFIASCD